MPKIAEYADNVLKLVAEELEIPECQILSKSREAEVVDARYLAVRLLHSHDIYPSRIASILGMSPRTVRHIITSFDARIQTNKSLRNIFAKIQQQLGDNLAITRQ